MNFIWTAILDNLNHTSFYPLGISLCNSIYVDNMLVAILQNCLFKNEMKYTESSGETCINCLLNQPHTPKTSWLSDYTCVQSEKLWKLFWIFFLTEPLL